MACPLAAQANLLTLARDICPFPDYTPHPHFNRLLSVNSSAHLREHYASVQAALAPEQRDAFTRRLRATFGREGNVTMGGVGVVALSLAVLFDTLAHSERHPIILGLYGLAKQARGQWVPETGPVRGLFKKELGGRYHVMVPVVSDYLRLVPHIANNAERMREETERFYRTLHNLRLDRDRKEKFTDLEAVNAILAGQFADHLRLHLVRLASLEEVRSIETSVFRDKFGYVEGEGGAARRRRQHRGLRYLFSLNCDAEAASKEFLAEVERLGKTNEEYAHCKPGATELQAPTPTLLHDIAYIEVRAVINDHSHMGRDPHEEDMIAQKESFDLKVDALGRWAI